jgi:hypothetical protein
MMMIMMGWLFVVFDSVSVFEIWERKAAVMVNVKVIVFVFGFVGVAVGIVWKCATF